MTLPLDTPGTPELPNNSTNDKGKDHAFFKPKTLSSKKGQPLPDNSDEADIWNKCKSCGDLSYVREFEKAFKVCQKCKYHHRLNGQERLTVFIDEGSWTEINAGITTADPLGFSADGEIYPNKIKSTRRKSGINESLLTGFGTVDAQPVGIAIADFSFLGASMGSVFGEKLVRLIDLCIERRMPLLTVNASGGARMHEGLFSLMQMAKTTAALGRLGKARLPHISLLTDPCYGGVTASYAMVADVILAEPGAMIGFAGPRVIEQTTRQKLPEDFQTAEFLLEHGMVDQVLPRKEFRQILSNLCQFYSRAELKNNARHPMAVLMAPLPVGITREAHYAG